MTSLIERLRAQAVDIAAAELSVWSNTMLAAADALQQLTTTDDSLTAAYLSGLHDAQWAAKSAAPDLSHDLLLSIRKVIIKLGWSPVEATAGSEEVVRQLVRAVEAELDQQPAAVDGECAIAAIQFALNDPEGMTFLRLWNEGEFETLRREWPEAPASVYVGADPSLAQQPAAVDEAVTGGCVVLPRYFLDFLLGQGALDGFWFGDKPATEKGQFWWRSRLRALACSAGR